MPSPVASFLAGRSPEAPGPVWGLEHRHAEGGLWTPVLAPSLDPGPLLDEMLAPTFALGLGDLVRLLARRPGRPQPITVDTWVETAEGPVAVGRPADASLPAGDGDWVVFWESPTTGVADTLFAVEPLGRTTQVRLACAAVRAAVEHVAGARVGAARPADVDPAIGPALDAAERWAEYVERVDTTRPDAGRGAASTAVVLADRAVEEAFARRRDRREAFDPMTLLCHAAHMAALAAVEAEYPWAVVQEAFAAAAQACGPPPTSLGLDEAREALGRAVRAALPVSALLLRRARLVAR